MPGPESEDQQSAAIPPQGSDARGTATPSAAEAKSNPATAEGDLPEAIAFDSLSQLRIISSQQLFCGARSVVISHGGQQYRLLVTKNDKLILQK